MTEDLNAPIMNYPEGDEINFIELLGMIWDARWFIIKITGIFIIAAVVVSLLLPNKYTATLTILPDTDQGVRSQLAQFSGLAAVAGIDLGGTSDVQLYPEIIKSESVLHEVIFEKYETTKFENPVNLIEYWEVKADTPEEEYEKILKKLREKVTSVSVARETRVVTLSVETKEPRLSADIANNIAVQLDSYMLTKRRTRASEQRAWIEKRLTEVEQELEKSEEALKDFRERNVRISDSPRLLLEQQRLIREVEVNNAMFVELKKQLEAIKIQEIRDIPIVQVLDYARIPVEKSGPKRRMTVITAFIFGGLLSIGVVMVRNFINKSQENKSFFQRITTDFKNDLNMIKPDNSSSKRSVDEKIESP